MISEFFSDDDFISLLRMFFSDDEREHLDFQSLLGQLKSTDDDSIFTLKVKGRTFQLDTENGTVEEIE